MEAGVHHAERCEQALAKDLAERPSGRAGDKHAEDERADVVTPALAGLLHQRQ